MRTSDAPRAATSPKHIKHETKSHLEKIINISAHIRCGLKRKIVLSKKDAYLSLHTRGLASAHTCVHAQTHTHMHMHVYTHAMPHGVSIHHHVVVHFSSAPHQHTKIKIKNKSYFNEFKSNKLILNSEKVIKNLKKSLNIRKFIYFKILL